MEVGPKFNSWTRIHIKFRFGSGSISGQDSDPDPYTKKGIQCRGQTITKQLGQEGSAS